MSSFGAPLLQSSRKLVIELGSFIIVNLFNDLEYLPIFKKTQPTQTTNQESNPHILQINQPFVLVYYKEIIAFIRGARGGGGGG